MTRPMSKTHRCKVSDMYDLYSEYRSILRADLSCASIWERLERYGSEITFIRRDIEMAIEKQEATSVPVLRVGSKG